MKCDNCGAPKRMCACVENETASALSRTLTFKRASDARAVRQEFLIEGWWPIGCLLILVGQAGAGKSLLMACHIADITNGKTADGIARNVLVLGAEDDWESSWQPRLMAVGADLDRVRYDASFTTETDGGNQGAYIDPFTLATPENLSALAEAMVIEDVSVLVLDHLDVALPSGSRSKDYDDMGRALRPLNAWAREHGLSVIAGWHLGKGGGAIADKFIGSTAIRGSARVMWVMAENPDDGLRYVALEKGNGLNRDIPALSFAVVGTTIVFDGEEIETVVASGLSEGDHWGAGWQFVEELINRAANPVISAGDDGKPLRADAWLADVLADGEKMKRFVVAQAEVAGYSERTIENAAARLGVESVKRGRLASWRLPDTQPPPLECVGPLAEVADVAPTSATSATSATSVKSRTSASGPTHPAGGGRVYQHDVPTGTVINLADIEKRLDA